MSCLYAYIHTYIVHIYVIYKAKYHKELLGSYNNKYTDAKTFTTYY